MVLFVLQLAEVFVPQDWQTRLRQLLTNKAAVVTTAAATAAENSVVMTRTYNDKIENVVVEKVDAVLEHICALDNAKHIRMDVRCSLNSVDEIEVAPQLKARITSKADSAAEIVLYSNTLLVSSIRTWIDTVHANYVFEKNNKLGNKMYFFNEIPVEPTATYDLGPVDAPPKKSYRWDSMPKMLTFSMNEFQTNKSFKNVYGRHVDELKKRLDLFVRHPEWYEDRGIPYSLGILLHGIPGAGKTSTIKAIAKDTHRHIFNLSLRPYTTTHQLTNLFYNETVIVQSYDGSKQTLKIPLNRRLYVIEDIDCLSEVVADRLATTTTTTEKEGDAVTLSFLLNLLDGVLETPGRILIISSNYPEKLDRALIRPGRIDVKIEFSYADREFIQDMMSKFYERAISLSEIPESLDRIFTPAEIMESLCMYFTDPVAACAHLVRKAALSKGEGTFLDSLGIAVPTPKLLFTTSSPSLVVTDLPPLPSLGDVVVGLTKENEKEKSSKYRGILDTTDIVPTKEEKAVFAELVKEKEDFAKFMTTTNPTEEEKAKFLSNYRIMTASDSSPTDEEKTKFAEFMKKGQTLDRNVHDDFFDELQAGAGPLFGANINGEEDFNPTPITQAVFMEGGYIPDQFRRV